MCSQPGTNSYDIFVRGKDYALWWRHVNIANGQWSAWKSLGGYLTSSPSATSWTSGAIFVAARGGNGQFYYTKTGGATWSPWTSLGGQILLGTAPAVTTLSGSKLGLFVIGTNQQLYWYDSGWKPLGVLPNGALLISSPAAASRTTNAIDVFARSNSDGDLWFKWTDDGGSSWSGWLREA